MAIHALDLPQLYTHPSPNTLLSVLDQLSASDNYSPFSHDQVVSSNDDIAPSLSSDKGITTYLTSVISSPLKWIPSEESKIQIWEAASTGLAQRAGRSAAPRMERRFRIPGRVRHQGTALGGKTKQDDGKQGGEGVESGEIEIIIREPSLTADNLGHKTWLASYLLARRLSGIIEAEFPQDVVNDGRRTQLRLLELGSGTGLLGIAATAMYPDLKVRLTDLPEIVENLQENVVFNGELFAEGKVPEVEVLDWSLVPDEPSSRPIVMGGFDIVMAADPLYSPEHPRWLVNAIAASLKRTKDSRIIVELPLRESYTTEVYDFQHRMLSNGFQLLSQGKEVGTEDWQTTSGERVQVECWWGIWKWQHA